MYQIKLISIGVNQLGSGLGLCLASLLQNNLYNHTKNHASGKCLENLNSTENGLKEALCCIIVQVRSCLWYNGNLLRVTLQCFFSYKRYTVNSVGIHLYKKISATLWYHVYRKLRSLSFPSHLLYRIFLEWTRSVLFALVQVHHVETSCLVIILWVQKLSSSCTGTGEWDKWSCTSTRAERDWCASLYKD